MLFTKISLPLAQIVEFETMAEMKKERKVVSIHIEDYEYLRKLSYEDRCTISDAVAELVRMHKVTRPLKEALSQK